MQHVTEIIGEPVTYNPLIDTAWATLDAAYDFKKFDIVDACRRVLDATYRGEQADERDLKSVISFFD